MTTEEPSASITPAVVVPIRRLDPFIGLATAVHSAPGVYALLLGSGISTAASIPTGWAIVSDLVRRAAAADNQRDEFENAGTFDPEAWWAEHGDDAELGYSSLLNSLASTPAGRDAILKTYFEASDEDRQEGFKLPTAAHEAIADLVARGSIRVILTTNFDRLMERALEQRGIQPQVIHRSEQIRGMTPLAHAAVTIIKLHGDYADLDKRNTVDELATYPPEQDALLRRVLDEYGLIISGWSGEWDIALVRATEEAKSRRYPMFWASYRQPSEAAGRLIAQVGAVSIENTGAEDLFVGLRDRLLSLDKLSAPPMSREMAVARLKRYLPDPVHRIDTHDVMMDEVKRVEMLLLDRERYSMAAAPGTNEEFWARYDDRVTRYRADVDTLLHLLAAGAYFAGPEHNGLWTSVIQRLLSSQKIPEGGYNGHLFNLSQYPTLLAIHVVLAVGALAGRDDLVGPVLARPSLKLSTMQTEESAAYVAHPWRVFENDAANALPRFGWLIPASTLGIIVGALTIGATYPHGLALSPLFGLLILGLAKGQGPFVRVLAMPKMVFGGEVSYSLYMTHMLVLSLVLKMLPASRFADSGGPVRWTVLFADLVLLVVAAVMTYLVVEKPARTRLRAVRFFEKPRSSETAVWP